MPYLGPQHLFLFEKRCLKKWPLFRRHPLSKWYIRVLPLSVCVLKMAAVPLIAKKTLDFWEFMLIIQIPIETTNGGGGEKGVNPLLHEHFVKNGCFH
jgi:hypothetical protein